MARETCSLQRTERTRVRREKISRRRGKEKTNDNRNGKRKITQRAWSSFAIVSS